VNVLDEFVCVNLLSPVSRP